LDIEYFTFDIACLPQAGIFSYSLLFCAGNLICGFDSDFPSGAKTFSFHPPGLKAGATDMPSRWDCYFINFQTGLHTEA
jgi:hypothetical protein